jgi:hypothetical protein
MTSFRRNFEMKILMEFGTRMMMRTLLLLVKKGRESSRIFPVESLPLKSARRRT